MSKWLSLLDKSIMAIPGFLILFFIILALLFFLYKALGCSFDDGGNYQDDYDGEHNDFKLVWPWLVNFIQIFRTSIGDLQPPQYPYWEEVYRKEPETAQSYITLIWAVFMAHVFLFVILLLNFLLAIISTAYDSL